MLVLRSGGGSLTACVSFELREQCSLLRTITDDYGAEFAAHSDSLAYRTVVRTVMCSPVRASQIAHALKLPRVSVVRRLEELTGLLIQVWIPCIALNVVSRKLLQCFRHIRERRRAVSSPNVSGGVPGNVVRHSLADASAVGDLFERVAPSVVR